MSGSKLKKEEIVVLDFPIDYFSKVTVKGNYNKV